jgi:YggT family protein
MIAQALAFLLDTVATLLIVALLLRFWLQAARAPFNNPLSGFLAAVTNWGVKPLRRVVPGLWGLDLATLMLAWLVAWALDLLLMAVIGVGASGTVALPGSAGGAGLLISGLLALVQLVRIFLYLLIVVVIVQAVLSWVNPYSPVSPLLALLARPFLAPIQRRMRPVSGFDLSPLVLLIVCQLALILLVGGLQSAVLMLR